MRDPYNAFCTQPPIRIEGAPKGPIAGLTFAVKDLFDFAGHVTGAGNPDWQRTHEPARITAVVVERLVSAGATALGKTHTDELSRGIFGENAHFGTPVNPRAPGRVPGGSSSGSAAAVAGELTDFALGTDTGGSVRVPASFCGIYGIRPTHGRLPLTGVVGQAPSFDTVGWFARDPNLLARVGAVLFGKEIAATLPNRLVIAEDAFAIADAERKKRSNWPSRGWRGSLDGANAARCPQSQSVTGCVTRPRFRGTKRGRLLTIGSTAPIPALGSRWQTIFCVAHGSMLNFWKKHDASAQSANENSLSGSARTPSSACQQRHSPPQCSDSRVRGCGNCGCL